MVPSWLTDAVSPPDAEARQAAARRQGQLTKPPGSLGRLESLAIRLAGFKGDRAGGFDPVHIVVFAADHGVVAEGVSAFPASVTRSMLRNFSHGGAAISVLAEHLGARLEVVNLGTVEPLGALPCVVDAVVAPGTRNFCREPAMSPAECARAVDVGGEGARRAIDRGANLFVGGEMGIGNTTTATALVCATLDWPAALLTGPGTGLDASGVEHKAAVVQEALARHPEARGAPAEALARLGGLEIAALVGAYVASAQRGIPVLVDGFVATAAALIAQRMNPDTAPWMIFGHRSAEPGHRHVLEALRAEPLLDLGMRLGEGSGAAVALPLVRQAWSLHQRMARFAEAGIDPEDRGP